jgi:hypothetical protein
MQAVSAGQIRRQDLRREWAPARPFDKGKIQPFAYRLEPDDATARERRVARHHADSAQKLARI